MATLVLTSIGRTLGGPLGALAGTLAGSALDRAVLGPTRPRTGLAELAVQGANYGDPLQRLYGRIRAGGQLIWSTGIRPRGRSGKGEDRRAYAASFAVALSARPILGVARIWADGRLIRDAAGTLAVPGRLRIHRGLPDQAPDPLIVAAEGSAGTPAYRGLAYAVFEEMGLDEFGNRIPQLSFEVLADPAAPSLATIIGDLFASAGEAEVDIEGLADRPLTGFGVPVSASLGECLDRLGLVEPMLVAGRAAFGRVAVRAWPAATAATITRHEQGATATGRPQPPREERLGQAGRAGGTAIVYLDPARDLQPGLQRAGRRGPGPERRETLPAAMTAGEARAAAERCALEAVRERSVRHVTGPVRLAVLEPGDRIAFEDEPGTWLVRRATLSGMVVGLVLEALTETGAPSSALAEAGRPDPNPLLVQGPTRLILADLPALPWDVGEAQRIVAVAGATGEAWRRVELLVSHDDGITWTSAGLITAPAAMGVAATVLPPGPANRWDERSQVEVLLDNPEAWLQTLPRASVLSGGNLALFGDELVQFAEVRPLAPGRFRLRGLLRGRFGTEPAMLVHAAGERFVLLEPAASARIDLPMHLLGSRIRVKGVGPLDDPAAAPAQVVLWAGQALKPWAPCRIAASRLADGSVSVRWVERGPAHTAWSSAPVSNGLPFRVTIEAGGTARTHTVPDAHLVLTAAEQLAQFGAPLTDFTVSVVQLHPAAGASDAALASISLAA